MRTRFLIAVGVIAAAAIAAGGCILTAPNRPSATSALAAGQVITAKPDSTPGPTPPPPPSPQPSISVQFTGADTVLAGQTSVTRWLFGNGGHSPITVAWTLSNDLGWSGLPKQGTIALAALSTQSLEVSVAVPDSAQPGLHAVRMTGTARNRTATADGFIRVFDGTPPPDTTGARAR